MSENQEISGLFLSTTDLMKLTYQFTADGKQYAVFSTAIAVPLDESPLMLELLSAKHVTLKATSSP